MVQGGTNDVLADWASAGFPRFPVGACRPSRGADHCRASMASQRPDMAFSRPGGKGRPGPAAGVRPASVKFACRRRQNPMRSTCVVTWPRDGRVLWRYVVQNTSEVATSRLLSSTCKYGVMVPKFASDSSEVRSVGSLPRALIIILTSVAWCGGSARIRGRASGAYSGRNDVTLSYTPASVQRRRHRPKTRRDSGSLGGFGGGRARQSQREKG